MQTRIHVNIIYWSESQSIPVPEHKYPFSKLPAKVALLLNSLLKAWLKAPQADGHAEHTTSKT